MLQTPSVKPQALLTMSLGSCRMNLESKENMDNEKLEQKAVDSTNLLYSTIQLKRIADILEEVLKLVKKDMGVK